MWINIFWVCNLYSFHKKYKIALQKKKFFFVSIWVFISNIVFYVRTKVLSDTSRAWKKKERKEVSINLYTQCIWNMDVFLKIWCIYTNINTYGKIGIHENFILFDCVSAFCNNRYYYAPSKIFYNIILPITT